MGSAYQCRLTWRRFSNLQGHDCAPVRTVGVIRNVSEARAAAYPFNRILEQAAVIPASLLALGREALLGRGFPARKVEGHPARGHAWAQNQRGPCRDRIRPDEMQRVDPPTG